MAEMKGIKLCGECINYDWKKHKCKIGCNDDSNAQAPFYGDCPLPDVVPKSEVEKLICKLECLLCHVTGGRLSKHTYDLGTMETVATDCINETYNDGYGEGYKECAREIFEEIETSLMIESFQGSDVYYAIRAEDYLHYKKKYTEGEK